jgi:hypothetical protein
MLNPVYVVACSMWQIPMKAYHRLPMTFCVGALAEWNSWCIVSKRN